VYAIGIHRQGDVDAVIDQKEGAIAAAELAQRLGLLQTNGIGDRLAVGRQASVLGAVLHQTDAPLERRLHDGLQPRRRTGHEIQARRPQAFAPLLPAGTGSDHIHLQVVEGVANRRGLLSQAIIQPPPEFLQDPQGLLDPAAVGRHHGLRLFALPLGRMGHPRRDITGGVAGLLVALVMQTPQALAHVLAAGHQIGPIEAKTAPVLDHPQPLAGAVEVGVQQPQDRSRLFRCGHGVCRGRTLCLGLRRNPTGMAMAQGESDSPMVVLISGILLLGAIAAFISWGLTNAYPGS